jgi:BirA family transcriptional regulator, biotin operon repressor / biotin---[acetyl-CoA-carboxylase] ligase
MTMSQPTNTGSFATAPTPAVWHAQALWEQLVGLLPGLSVEVVARMSSTNTALLDRARVANGAVEPDLAQSSDAALVRRSAESRAFGRRAVDLQPCLLVAEHQTAGRGRQGHHWYAAAGSSLTFSLALTMSPPDWAGLSLAVGVALAEALDPLMADQPSPRLCIKWPNDLWLMNKQVDAHADAYQGRAGPGRKLGGVLIETVASGDKRLVVVGVGLNVLPIALNSAQASTGTACLQEMNAALDAPTALARVALPLVNALQSFERSGFAAFADRFAARNMLFQRRVTATQAGLQGVLMQGVAQGVSAGGALQVQTSSGLQSVSSGEVSVRPMPDLKGGSC